MANLTFKSVATYPTIDLAAIRTGLTDLVFSYDDILPTATLLRFSDDAANGINFIGTGLTYNIATMQVTGGTLSAISVDWAGTKIIQVSGLKLDAPTFANYLLSDQSERAFAMITKGNDLMVASKGNDVLLGGTGNDTLKGAGGADRLQGEAGKDRLEGAAGADTLSGDAGNDTLIGGAGIDRLTGGAGKDVFVFDQAKAGGRDILTDFASRSDRIHLDSDVFDDLSYTGKLKAADFVAGTAAKDASDRLIYDQSSGNLWYDSNGSAKGGKVLIAELTDGTALVAGDIFLV